jgi:hypothetical protein
MSVKLNVVKMDSNGGLFGWLYLSGVGFFSIRYWNSTT